MTDLLTYVPEQGGYAVAHPEQVIAVQLDGGAPRLRADRLHASGSVSASWLLDRVDYNLFLKFWRESTLFGSLPFLVDLVTDSFQLARHRCTFVPGSLRTTQVTGLTYRVGAELRPDQLISYTDSFNAKVTGGNIVATPTAVNLSTVLANPTNVQILGFSLNDGVHPPITLDGIYPVSGYPTTNSIELVNATLINPDWVVLGSSYPAGPTANVANVMIVNSPT